MSPTLDAAPSVADVAPTNPAPQQPATRPSAQEVLRWFLDELHQDIITGTLKINSPGAQVYCGARYTLVAVPRAIDAAANRVSAKLEQHGMAPLTREKRHTGLLELLTSTAAGLTYGAGRKSIILKALIARGLKPLSGAVLRNDLLWQASKNGSIFPGIFQSPLVLTNRKTNDPMPVRGFLSSNALVAEVHRVVTGINALIASGQAVLNRIDGDVLVFHKAALILNPPRGNSEIDRNLLSEVTLHLPDRKPVIGEALILPASLLALPKVECSKGFFRFVRCR